MRHEQNVVFRDGWGAPLTKHNPDFLSPKVRRNNASSVYRDSMSFLKTFGHEQSTNSPSGRVEGLKTELVPFGQGFIWMQTYGFSHRGDRPLPGTKIEIWVQVNGEPTLLYKLGKRNAKGPAGKTIRTKSGFAVLNEFIRRMNQGVQTDLV